MATCNIFHPYETEWGWGGGPPPDGPWQAQLQGFYYMLTAHVDSSTLVVESGVVMGTSDVASEQQECVTALRPIVKGYDRVRDPVGDLNWFHCRAPQYGRVLSQTAA